MVHNFTYTIEQASSGSGWAVFKDEAYGKGPRLVAVGTDLGAVAAFLSPETISNTVPLQLAADTITACGGRNKIAMIKALRLFKKGAGLREAKEAIEASMARRLDREEEEARRDY